MSSPQDGYLLHYNDGLFTDLELNIGTTTYHVHQLIIGNASDVFARAVERAKCVTSTMLGDQLSADSSEPKDAILACSSYFQLEKVGGRPWRGKLRCHLQPDSYASYWPDLIAYMYTGQLITLNVQNIVGWFCIATEFELNTLKNELIEWIVANVSKSDLYHLLPQIVAENRASQFLRYIVSVVAKNFSDFVEADRYTRTFNSSSSSPSKTATATATAATPYTAPLSKSPSALSSLLVNATTESDSKSFHFDWRVFPFQAMKDLLHDQNLFAASEEDVFEAIMHYLEKYSASEAKTEDFSSLFEAVRFERLEYSTLEAALAHPLVPKELLSRALMARLAGFEKPVSGIPGQHNALSSSPSSLPLANTFSVPIVPSRKSPVAVSMGPGQSASSPKPGPSFGMDPLSTVASSATIPLSTFSTASSSSAASSSNALVAWPSNSTPTSGPARDRRRQSYGRLFQWSSDFDTKGVLYYLGTREYRNEWSNPKSQNLVDVTWSSLEKGKASAIFEREPSECWTQDVPSSWLTIDLGAGRSLRITAYTLRHGGATKQDLIRNWTLKGSVDGLEFTTLMRHKDDESLSTPFASKTWTISGATQAYRFFKVIQTGHNSSKHNFLSIGGVEFYGELIYDMTAVSKFSSSSGL